jgi:hypothetical protein
MDDVANGWRHRKNGHFIQLESPNLRSQESQESGTTQPKGLPGFRMSVTKQGLRFYREGSPKEASFIDAGRIIRVYAQDDDTLLAALQLAQEKWGGVKLNGTEEYKHRCAELAAQHGIRIANPELQGFIKAIRQPKPPLSPEYARNTIETEEVAQKIRHRKLYDAYSEHKKALREHIESEPRKPLVLGVKKWKEEHEQWKIERDNLGRLIIDDLKALGVDTDKPDIAEREAEQRHKSIQEFAHSEAIRLHPEAAEVIRRDEAINEQKQRESEALEREKGEKYNRLRSKVRELAKARTGKEVFLVTDAQKGRKYSGVLIGVVEQEGRHIAVQALYGGHVIMHNIPEKDVLKTASLAGRSVDITGGDGFIRAEVDRSEELKRDSGWSR